MAQVNKLLVKKPFVRQAIPISAPETTKIAITNIAYSEVLPPESRYVVMTQAEFAAEYDPRGHKIYNTSIYPDKEVRDEKGKFIRKELVSRVSLGLQKMIALKQAVHLMGNPPRLTATKRSNSDLFVDYKEYRRVKGIHSAIYLGVKSALTTGDGAIYFFRDKKGRLQWKVWSYSDGDTLIPTYYDDGITLQYFVRRYRSVYNGETVDTIDVISETSYTTYAQLSDQQKSGLTKVLEYLGLADERWTEISSNSHGFTQVPVAYQRNTDVAWGDGQELIETIERTLSDLRESDAYFALGILSLTGDIEVLPAKGTQGKVILGEENSEAKLLEQNDVSPGFKYEIQTYLEQLFDITGTVIIRNEDLKGGDITGAAIRNYYNPAIQYAIDKAPNYYSFLNQIESITIEGMGLEQKRSSETKNLEVISEIDVYVPANTMEVAQKIQMLVTSGVLSKETAAEINEYSAPDEIKRLTNQIEDEKRRSIETIQNQNPTN